MKNYPNDSGLIQMIGTGKYIRHNWGNKILTDMLIISLKVTRKLAASKAYSIPPAMCSCLNIAKFKTL